MSNNKNTISFSFGIPSAVIGALIALKYVGATNITYGEIIWFGIKVWFACAAIVLAIVLFVAVIMYVFVGYDRTKRLFNKF